MSILQQLIEMHELHELENKENRTPHTAPIPGDFWTTPASHHTSRSHRSTGASRQYARSIYSSSPLESIGIASPQDVRKAKMSTQQRAVRSRIPRPSPRKPLSANSKQTNMQRSVPIVKPQPKETSLTAALSPRKQPRVQDMRRLYVESRGKTPSRANSKRDQAQCPCASSPQKQYHDTKARGLRPDGHPFRVQSLLWREEFPSYAKERK